MNYQAFTDDSLKMMYEAVRGVLASDDAAELRRKRLDSVSVKRLTGDDMRPIWKWK